MNSVNKIKKVLLEVGAQTFNEEYEHGILTAVNFSIDINHTTHFFKLPANIGAIESILKSKVKRPVKGTFERIAKQAERTAWKVVLDWVEIQCTMIQMRQAEFVQVFLPYVFMPAQNKTFFEVLKGQDFQLLE